MSELRFFLKRIETSSDDASWMPVIQGLPPKAKREQMSVEPLEKLLRGIDTGVHYFMGCPPDDTAHSAATVMIQTLQEVAVSVKETLNAKRAEESRRRLSDMPEAEDQRASKKPRA